MLIFQQYVTCVNIATSRDVGELMQEKYVGLLFSERRELEDTKGVIIIRISKKNRQHNGLKKKYKRTNNDLHSIHIIRKIE